MTSHFWITLFSLLRLNAATIIVSHSAFATGVSYELLLSSFASFLLTPFRCIGQYETN